MKFKKLLPIILSILLLLAVIPFGNFTVFAEYGSCGDNVTWELEPSPGSTLTDQLRIYGSGAMNNYSSLLWDGKLLTDAPWRPYYDLIKTVVIDAGVTTIGAYAFYGCNSFTRISIPDSVTSIGYDAFRGCTGLTSIVIPDSVTSIGAEAFRGCTGLKSVTIPDSVTSIGANAFRDCSNFKTAGPIGGGYKIEFGWTDKIPDYAFSGCSKLTSITIPDSVTSIGSYAFKDCTGITSITIPNNVTSIGDRAFYSCTGLKSITIPDSVRSISYYTFYSCTGLTSITIPDNVRSIGFYAFYDCTGLTSITIPDSVTSIGSYAFEGCTGLKTVYYCGTYMQWNSISISSNNVPLTSTMRIQHHYTNVVSNDLLVSIANCTHPTLYYKSCDCCGNISSETFEIGKPLGHNYINIIDKEYLKSAADLTHTAIYYKSCSRCGEKSEQTFESDIYMPCGYNCGFIIENSVLNIHGNSNIDNYNTQGSVPWYCVADEITEIQMDSGITKIGNYAFYCLNNLDTVIIKNKNIDFGKYAFNSGNENIKIFAESGGSVETYCRDNGITYIDPKPLPVLISATADTITVEKNNGYEYSIDSTAWQESGVFTGLSSGTNYEIYARHIKTATHFSETPYKTIVVKTDKAKVPAPDKPVCVRNTDTKITLQANDLYEYSIDGENWQKSNVFTGLIHKNTYSLYQRVAETETEYASEPSAPLIMQLVKKSVSAPEKPVCVRNTDTEITLQANDLYEYSIDGENWQKSNVFTGLTHKNVYSLYQRLSETETEYASPASAPLIMRLVKKTVSAPDAPDYKNHTENSITLVPNDLYEYSMDGENWQKSSEFTGLSKNVIYRFYQRVAETETEYASEPSAALITAIPDKPEILEAGYENILLKKIDGFEYCLDDFVWQDSNSFNMLIDDTLYCVYQRIATIDGEKVYQITSDCTPVLTDNSKTHTHSFGEWFVKTESTCTEKGEEDCICADCGYTEKRDVNPLGHDYINAAEEQYLKTAADCTHKAVYYKSCSRCGIKSDETFESGEPLGHDYIGVITTPTCTEQGYTTYTCSRCSDSYVSDYTNALGHTGGTATCHSKAVCTRCHEEYGEINPANHDGETEVRGAVAATCTVAGYTGDTYCLGCGVKIATGEVVAKLGHDYKAVVTNPTCTEQGYTTYTCSRCSDSYVSDYTNATGHTLGEWLNDENNHWHICAACSEKLDEAAHTVSDWITDPEPTTQTAGEKHKECTVCGKVLETEIIPDLHTPGDINDDGVVDNKDLIRLFKYLSGCEVVVNEAALDINDDGDVNNKDLTRLVQYLTGWKVEIY